MDKYEVLSQIGDGTFGSVAKAMVKRTGQPVAIKKMKQKYYTWEECTRLPEVDVVRRIHGHPNIVKLREVIRENNELYFVFEYMDGDMLGVIRKAKQAQCADDAATSPALPYATVRHYMCQLLQALAYLHKRGYFHRDLKPENLLVRREDNGAEVVKLGDFGLVKESRARPPFTDYVSTRWYRAPELLLQDRAYTCAVDVWAAGCMMAELITTRPLFPGSNEVDQLHKIMHVLGSPTEQTWSGGMLLARKIHYTFPSVRGVGLAAVLPKHMPPDALEVLTQMLCYDPRRRISAEQCLQHPFFRGADDAVTSATRAQLAAVVRRMQLTPQSAPAGTIQQSNNAIGGTTLNNNNNNNNSSSSYSNHDALPTTTAATASYAGTLTAQPVVGSALPALASAARQNNASNSNSAGRKNSSGNHTGAAATALASHGDDAAARRPPLSLPSHLRHLAYNASSTLHASSGVVGNAGDVDGDHAMARVNNGDHRRHHSQHHRNSNSNTDSSAAEKQSSSSNTTTNNSSSSNVTPAPRRASVERNAHALAPSSSTTKLKNVRYNTLQKLSGGVGGGGSNGASSTVGVGGGSYYNSNNNNSNSRSTYARPPATHVLPTLSVPGNKDGDASAGVGDGGGGGNHSSNGNTPTAASTASASAGAGSAGEYRSGATAQDKLPTAREPHTTAASGLQLLRHGNTPYMLSQMDDVVQRSLHAPVAPQPPPSSSQQQQQQQQAHVAHKHSATSATLPYTTERVRRTSSGKDNSEHVAASASAPTATTSPVKVHLDLERLVEEFANEVSLLGMSVHRQSSLPHTEQQQQQQQQQLPRRQLQPPPEVQSSLSPQSHLPPLQQSPQSTARQQQQQQQQPPQHAARAQLGGRASLSNSMLHGNSNSSSTSGGIVASKLSHSRLLAQHAGASATTTTTTMTPTPTPHAGKTSLTLSTYAPLASPALPLRNIRHGKTRASLLSTSGATIEATTTTTTAGGTDGGGVGAALALPLRRGNKTLTTTTTRALQPLPHAHQSSVLRPPSSSMLPQVQQTTAVAATPAALAMRTMLAKHRASGFTFR